MKDVKEVFRSLEKQLRQSSWFKGGWEIYNRGVYLHLYKDNWHNQNQGGIHFETYIEAREIKQKSFPICFHVENDCPSQKTFIKEFLTRERDRIKGWKGYQIGEGYNICSKSLPLNFKNLDQKIFEELNRLRQLESGIDAILNDVED